MKSQKHFRMSIARDQLVVLLAGLLACAGSLQLARASSINAMSTALPSSFNPGHMLLLPDGRVMVQTDGGSAWEFLSPDGSGHYGDGTWSSCPSMNYSREFYSSDVLQNGKVFVAGGEYNADGTFGEPDGAKAEVFDPQANNGAGSWTEVDPPTSLLDPSLAAFSPYGGYNQGFADSESVVVADGNVLVAPVFPGILDGTLLYNPFNNTWSAGGTSATYNQDEASWVKLPDDSILTIDPYGTDCQRYLPASNTWIQDATVPINLYSTNSEIGASLLMANGKVLYVGGNNQTEIYTPSPLGGNNNGSWSPGPNLPGSLVMRDAPSCVLNNGKLLLALVPPTGDSPIYLYEYDPNANSFNFVFEDTSGQISDRCAMIQLPDGDVLFDDTHVVYDYTPDPSPLAAGQPQINKVQWNPDGTLHLTGTVFNGISQGAMYGDDQQQDSNYPLVKFTSGGNVYYGRTYNWSSTSVATGGKVVTTEVALPPAVFDFPNSYTLQVVANGNASAPVSFYGPVWVDVNNYNSFFEFGYFQFPYGTLPQGVSAVASGGTVAFDASTQPSTATVSVPYTISTPMTIISVYGPTTITQ
jgi:hypothetical protein